ncbi:BppU family phage baseplate upper protein, partial [Ligilactobacillus salivarius]
MTRTILDLAKPKTTVFDLSNVLNPRVNDDLAKISFHIQYDNKPFNMTGYKMYFISADENMGYINIDGMVDKIEVGDNVGNGDVTFKFPPNVFKKAGTFDSAKTMFAIENINSNYIQSTINISLTVLENGIAKFNADV